MALAALITMAAVLDAQRSPHARGKGWAAETGFSPHESWNAGPAVTRHVPAASPAAPSARSPAEVIPRQDGAGNAR